MERIFKNRCDKIMKITILYNDLSAQQGQAPPAGVEVTLALYINKMHDDLTHLDRSIN